MSSAILYLAIVAIWVGVLVPRWLRPAQVAVRATDTRQRGEVRGHGEARGEDTGMPWPDSDSDTEPIPTVRPEHDHLVERAGRAAPRRSQRAMILQARRRMFVMITILTAGAVGMAGTHMAAWWVVVPPGIMLGGFMLVLREAARTDTARGRRLAAEARAEVGARAGADAEVGARAATGAGRAVRQDAVEGVEAAEASPAAVAEPEPTWSAEIIDISARLNDQLYDQYADAAVRAVGD